MSTGAEDAYYGGDGYADETDAIFARLRQRHEDEMAELDRQDAELASADAADRAELRVIAGEGDEMEIENAIRAADLARDGYDPGGDWREVLARNGLDEDGNPSDGFAVNGRPRARVVEELAVPAGV